MSAFSHRTGWRRASAHMFAISFLTLTDQTVAQVGCDPSCTDGELCMPQLPFGFDTAGAGFDLPAFGDLDIGLSGIGDIAMGLPDIGDIDMGLPGIGDIDMGLPGIGDIDMGLVTWACQADPCSACEFDETCDIVSSVNGMPEMKCVKDPCAACFAKGGMCVPAFDPITGMEMLDDFGLPSMECVKDPCAGCSEDEMCVPSHFPPPSFPEPYFPDVGEGSDFLKPPTKQVDSMINELTWSCQPSPSFTDCQCEEDELCVIAVDATGALKLDQDGSPEMECLKNECASCDDATEMCMPVLDPDTGMPALGETFQPMMECKLDPCLACKEGEMCLPKLPSLGKQFQIPVPNFPDLAPPLFPPGFPGPIEMECQVDPCLACQPDEICVPDFFSSSFSMECKFDPCQACTTDEICAPKAPTKLIPKQFQAIDIPGVTEMECQPDPCKDCAEDEICMPTFSDDNNSTDTWLVWSMECQVDPCAACDFPAEICVPTSLPSAIDTIIGVVGGTASGDKDGGNLEFECKPDPCAACTGTEMCVPGFGNLEIWSMECQADPCLACEDDEICVFDFVSETAVDSAAASWIPSWNMKCQADPCAKCVLEGGMCVPRFDSFMDLVMTSDGFGFEVQCLLETGCAACDLDKGELCLPEIDQDAGNAGPNGMKMACQLDPCAACKQDEMCEPIMDKSGVMLMKCTAIKESASDFAAVSSSAGVGGSSAGVGVLAPASAAGTECMPACKQTCANGDAECMKPCAARCAQQFIYKQAAAARPGPQTPAPGGGGDSGSTGAVPEDENGFDFGSGCEAGTGSFTRTLERERDTSVLGIIPADKYGVKVNLVSLVDIDIQLLDMKVTDKFSEGAAIVAYCEENGCNRDLVFGVSPGVVEADYQRPGIAPMRLKYSGYNGVDGALGNEFIEVSGATTTDLMMRVYAYRTGVAQVSYSWERSLSNCCRGLESCPGEPFSKAILEKEIVTIGEIPVGKKNVRIQLRADLDVDIQLYDASDTGVYDEGKALIGYCETAGCNLGKLSGPGRDSYFLDGVEYVYSGYNGENNQIGHEYIEINGVTNRPLVMKAFGYTAGSAKVTYSWYELE